MQGRNRVADTVLKLAASLFWFVVQGFEKTQIL